MNRLSILALAAATTALAFRPFEGTNAGGKLFVCATPQPNNLDLGGYIALVWVEVGGIGSVGETGTQTNILTYDTWNDEVVRKQKGMSNAGDPPIELARIPGDAGQAVLRNAAKTKFNYAFKIVWDDATVPGATGTTLYTRGLVTGPTRPNGRNEDFMLEVFTLGLQQLEIIVDPTSGGVAPFNTVLPAITGTPADSEVLTASSGTWTGDAVITYSYQWYANGVAIVGATANTYNLTTAEVGKYITVAVTATNAAGAKMAASAPTASVSP